eukprot:2272030-Rhodomonas_salina.2
MSLLSKCDASLEQHSYPHMPRSTSERNPEYTYTTEVYEVLRIDGWHLNMTSHELEWEVVWANGEILWEPNCNSRGYCRAVFDFICNAEELPTQH